MRRLLSLTFVFLAMLVGVAQHAGVASAAGYPTGVSYVSDNDPTTFSRVAGAGATMVHSWVRWDQIAPAVEPESWNPRNPVDPNYNWSALDTWVTNAVAAGLTPMLQVYYSPDWADRCVTNPPITITDPPCDPDPAAMADFGRALAKRYDGNTLGLPKVRYFQGQNEPNLGLFFGPQRNARGVPVSPRLYRTLLNRFYEAVKSVDSRNIVISAGLAPNPNHWALAPLDFARRLFCMVGRAKPKPTRAKCTVKADIVDMHPYTSGGPTHKALNLDGIQLGDLGKLKKLVAAADRAHRIKGMYARTPLWVTEMSWDSNRPDPGGVPMNLLRRWTSQAVYQAWKAKVARFFWYSLRDQSPNGLPWSATTQSGLYFRGDTVEQDRAKPILQAFRFPFVAFGKGKKAIFVWGRNPQAQRGWVSIQRFRHGRWQKLKPVMADSGGLFRRVIRVPAGSNRAGTVRAVFRGQVSVPFSLKAVKDRPARPFG
ncbi:MAG: hypothetical protein J0H66_03560 [Solirubrobacterales bacterium]|nr:hypothetical protein [Solirubrobacterales bacterium]